MAARAASSIDPEIRKNLLLSLTTLMGDGRNTVVVETEAMDRIYRLAQTAAMNSPALLLVRGGWLMRRDENPDEQEAILAKLRTWGRLYSGTWILEIIRGVKTRDLERVRRAVEIGLALKNASPDHMAKFKEMAKALKEK